MRLIAVMLGRLRMSVNDCIAEYKALCETVFGHRRLASIKGPFPWPRDKYDDRALQKAIDDVVMRRLSSNQRQVGGVNFNSPPGLCKTCVSSTIRYWQH